MCFTEYRFAIPLSPHEHLELYLKMRLFYSLTKWGGLGDWGLNRIKLSQGKKRIASKYSKGRKGFQYRVFGF